MSLDYHLCADKNVGFMVKETAEDFFVAFFFPGGIRVHTKGTGFGIHFVDYLFHLFGAGFEAKDIFGPALWAGLVRIGGIAAIVAYHLTVSVKGQRNVAVRTFYYKAAGSARHEARHAAAIKKQHYLLVLIKPVLNQFLKVP